MSAGAWFPAPDADACGSATKNPPRESEREARVGGWVAGREEGRKEGRGGGGRGAKEREREREARERERCTSQVIMCRPVSVVLRLFFLNFVLPK